ncbi:MAG: NYN domain-containing protein [Parachlamydiaceae bacterium]
MSVLYLIDGYNLFFRTTRGEEGENFSKEREKIILSLAEQIQIAHLSALLVFDSAWHEGPAERKIKHQLEICYTDLGQSADDWIISEVKRAEKPAQITVVTSDRKLAWRARLKGAMTQPVEEFLLMLRRIVKKKKAPPKQALATSKIEIKKPPTLQERYEKAFTRELEEEPIEKKKTESLKKKVKPQEPSISDYDRWLKAFENGA